MDGRGALTQDAAYQKLKEYHDKNGDSINIAKLFAEDSDRFEKFRYVIALYHLDRGRLRFACVYEKIPI